MDVIIQFFYSKKNLLFSSSESTLGLHQKTMPYFGTSIFVLVHWSGGPYIDIAFYKTWLSGKIRKNKHSNYIFGVL